MRLTTENLGAIKKAQFDLNKRLIVFFGPNSSGKTHESIIFSKYKARQYANVVEIKRGNYSTSG